MAIFRAETKHISRGKGHNVVAAAAYRAGQKLTDTNEFNPDAKTHDYTKKHGVVASDIILPSSLIDQDFTIDRQTLWSSVEQSETTTRSVKGSRLKQSARLGREWLLSLPSELSDDENIELTREFTTKLVNDLGVIADYAIHKPTPFDIKPKKFVGDDEKRIPIAPDERNVHAHIMFTTRKVSADRNGVLVFGDKADSDRSEKWRQEQGLCNGGDYIKEIRQLWATMLNKRLEQKNILPVTAKSYEDLGLDIIPQHKQGKDATVMSRYHFKPPIMGFNNDIKQLNRITIKSATASCTAISNDRIDSSKQQISDSEQQLSSSQQRLNESATAIKQSDICYDRVAEFEPQPSRASERTREREQLIVTSTSKERYFRSGVESATDSYRSNIAVIASRLAWRKEHSSKYDDRQMQALDTFYRTLNIRDFTLATNQPNPAYEHIAAHQWGDAVKDKITLDDIINNHHIIAIIRDPILERENRISKTSQNASGSVETSKHYDSSLEVSKPAERDIETSTTATRIYRP